MLIARALVESPGSSLPIMPVASMCHCFTSKRLLDDQLPGVPEAELARTRHHILIVGSVLVVNCDAVVFAFTSGEEKVSASSIWIV
jgi:hypothetical protein